MRSESRNTLPGRAARDAAARAEYATMPADSVDAGWEANGSYAALPGVDRLGHLPPGVDINGQTRHPKVRVEFSLSDDSRPGVGYCSLASGKAVVTSATP
jgi:hypothetical protein